MSKKFLIVVGLPKSGTTFLYAETAKRADRFVMPVAAKEVDYFRRGRDLDQYLSLFEGGAGDGDGTGGDRVYMDASPLYIDDLDTSLDNMAHALAGQDVRIVVCFRDPLERAYSHYLHDVAQNQKITGHGDYSFWSPTVMAKYLFPLAPRVQALVDRFGTDRVHGFAFGTDMSGFEQMLRDFAGLEPDWSLNLRDNPAPGFTSPQCLYNAEADTEVAIRGHLYALRAGHMLVLNRQFSLHRPDMHRPLAEQIMMRQASLTRSLDTGMLADGTRARIYDDSRRAAALTGLDLPLDDGPRLMQSRISEDVPDWILKRLKPICTLDSAVEQMFATGTQRSMKTIAQMPGAGVSLARDMARINLAHHRDPDETTSVRDLQRHIVHTHGPIPYYIEGLMNYEVARGNYDAALGLFESYGGAGALLWPIDLAHFLLLRQITLPDEVAARFRASGIRVALVDRKPD